MTGSLDRPPITIIGERQSVAAAVLPTLPLAGLFGLIGYAPFDVLIHHRSYMSILTAVGVVTGAGLMLSVIAAFWLLLVAAAIKPPRVQIAPEGIKTFPSVGPCRMWSWADVDQPFLQAIPKSDAYNIMLNRRGKRSEVDLGYGRGIYPLGPQQMLDMINAGKAKWGGDGGSSGTSRGAV